MACLFLQPGRASSFTSFVSVAKDGHKFIQTPQFHSRMELKYIQHCQGSLTYKPMKDTENKNHYLHLEDL